MNNLYELNNLINKYSVQLKGVFTISDLKNLFNDFNSITFFRKIKKLENNNILKKFTRGIYTARNFDPENLSAKINKDSYISFGNILSKELVIGSVPGYTITCVKTGRNRSYNSGYYKIIYLSIAPHLFFGYETKNGMNYALKEKAFLDTLYFYQKGRKFSFNVFDDINIKLLNIKKVYVFLKEYKNEKFIKFVERYLDERI